MLRFYCDSSCRDIQRFLCVQVFTFEDYFGIAWNTLRTEELVVWAQRYNANQISPDAVSMVLEFDAVVQRIKSAAKRDPKILVAVNQSLAKLSDADQKQFHQLINLRSKKRKRRTY